MNTSMSVESSVAVSAENVTLKSALKKPKKDVSVSFKQMNESDDESVEDSLDLNEASQLPSDKGQTKNFANDDNSKEGLQK